MQVKDCMCKEIYFVKEETNIYDVSKIMNENKIGSVVICDTNNKACGIVTDRDIVIRGIANGNDIRKTQVKEIMSTNICTCGSEDRLTDVEKKMGDWQIRRLPVCNKDDEPIGFISFGDIAKNSKQINNYEVISTIEKICCDCVKENK